MSNPLDEPSIPTPQSTTPVPEEETAAATAHHKTLAIEDAAPAAEQQGENIAGGEEIQTLDLGEGNVIKLDKLGPMIINSDGTLSRIQNWQDLHPIEQERTVRLLVKKRNLVRLEKLSAEDGNQKEGEEILTALEESR